MTKPLISICVLAGHSEELLERLLESLGEQVGAPDFELLVGGNDAGEEAAMIRRHFPDAKVCSKPKGHPGFARNALISQAEGELLLFLDDDVIASPQLLRGLADVATAHPRVSVFGGPNETPPRSSRFQFVQGAVLSSLVGSGPVSRRYGARHPGPADERWFTLCNLAVRRDVMLPFRRELVCAEENALLGQLRAQGEQMLYEPSLRVFHARRPTWRTFARQMLKYGHGRGQLLMRRPATTRLAFIAPSLLVAYLALLPVLLIWRPLPALILLAPLAAYAALLLAGAARVAATLRRPASAPLALGLALTVHLCYGVGVLRGISGRLQTRSRRALAWSRSAEEVATSEPAR